MSPLSPASDEVDVGVRLRQVRLARRLTLRDVARAAGISESFLSQLERGRANASVATLRRVAAALGLGIGDLFAAESPDQPRILRAASRPVLMFGSLGRKIHLHSAPDRAFDIFICEFEPGGSTGDEPYAHGDSEEIAVVLAGSVRIQIGPETCALATDDSVIYRSSTPHRIEADDPAGARVLFVSTPPSF
ncbi:MAG: helix-turn-helix domain-containing protein [Streptosporangiaceae bacterium]